MPAVLALLSYESVGQNYVRGEFGRPKSKRSSRSVPLVDHVAGELDRHFKSSMFQADDARSRVTARQSGQDLLHRYYVTVALVDIRERGVVRRLGAIAHCLARNHRPDAVL